jgi:hypothetical protein
MEIQGHDLKVGEGLAGQMVAIGMPIFVNDDSSWAFRSREFADILRLRLFFNYRR